MIRQRLTFLDPPGENEDTPIHAVQMRSDDERESDFNASVKDAKDEKQVGTKMALERTIEANERTEMAIVKTELANKRTLLAYVRTALAISTLAKKEDNSLIAIIGLIFISLAMVDYLYNYFDVHPSKRCKLPTMCSRVIYVLSIGTPVIVAIVAMYVLGIYT